MDELLEYFPQLTSEQEARFRALGPLYTEWNEKINVVSRKDIGNIYPHHILHSLAIAKFFTPDPGAVFIDLGTGGGFPGIPLAILWPECRFHLIDRIGKKVRVAEAVADTVGLRNVTFQHGDMGECKVKADYVVSRAVMQLDELVKACAGHVKRGGGRLPAGLLCLKGGELEAELGRVRRPKVCVPLSDYFKGEYFSTKSLIYVEL